METNNFIWFETNKIDKENYLSYYFLKPVKILKLTEPEKLKKFFAEIERLSKKCYLAGFFSYELGYLFEDIFKYKKRGDFPLALFYAYEMPIIFDNIKKKFIQGKIDLRTYDLKYQIKELRMNVSREKYIKDLIKIKNYIYNGDIYQANYTFKYKFKFIGSAIGFYNDLKLKQRVAYNVFAKMGEYYILSLSPELFFYKNKEKLIVKPMKGTVRRGINIEDDKKYYDWLKNDIKNRAENVMIVDLLRNDIGKISERGSVKVKKLFEVEKYDTLFQMTSTIESKVRKDITIYNLIKSIFPSGSVTGAPKIRSMEIIKEVEKEERQIYTGAIGFFTPQGMAKFNVAIRTILIKNNESEMGIGGGIVYDSSPESELTEAKLKGLFLIKKPVAFSLIETLLYDKGFKNLKAHFKRLKESSEYFEFKFEKKKIISKMKDIELKLGREKYKIRILLDRDGKIDISYEDVYSVPEVIKITISNQHTDSNNIFLYHKTTNRDLYGKELKNARENGFFDIIFLNEKDEITEGAITNIYIKKDGLFYTPPISSGLLNGIIRQIKVKELNIKEKILRLEDLKEADEVYISNSIIGFKKVRKIDFNNYILKTSKKI